MPSLGKVGLLNRGTYSSSAVYNAMDFVYYNGSTYICLRNSVTNVTPNNNGTDWRYLAQGFVVDTTVFCRKADMKSSLTTSYTAGQYAADASVLKTLNDKIKTYTASSPLSISSSNVISLAASGATPGDSAVSIGETGNKTPAFGGTFKVPSFTVDKFGRLTVAADHTVKIPAYDSASVSVVGTTSITWNSSFVTSSNNSIFMKCGKVVTLLLNFTSTGDYSSGGYVNLGTIPTGYWPRYTVVENAVPNRFNTSGATALPVVVQLGANQGEINIMNYKGADHLGVRTCITYLTNYTAS